MFSFNNTILLWCITTSSLGENAMAIVQNFHVSFTQFTSIITPNTLDNNIELSLNHFQEIMHHIYNIIFMFQEMYPSESAEIIYNSQELCTS